MNRAPRRLVELLRTAHVVFVSVVFLLVIADPTPRFLGFATDSESPQKALPANGGSNDYDAPLVGRPPAAAAEESLERAAIRTPVAAPLDLEQLHVDTSGVGPLRAAGFAALTRSAPLRC